MPRLMDLSSTTSLLILLLMSCSSFHMCSSTDSISISKTINDSESVVSNNGIFRFGFFSPLNSSRRYAGIWYNNIPLTTVVWVANKNNPIADSSGVVSISSGGNLVVLDGQSRVLWSSNVSVPSAANGTTARLLDTGNLVLEENNNNNRGTLWESFENPCDTFLPKMFIRTNSRTGEKIELRSWKSPSDPSRGSYTTGIDALEIPEFFIWNDNVPFWRSGPWNGQVFLGVPNMAPLVFLDGFRFENDDNGTASMTYSDSSYLYRFSLDSKGKVSRKNWDKVNGRWNLMFSFPATDCDVYGYCGEFGSCNTKKNPLCSCIEGFEPRNRNEWIEGNWTSGCARRMPLNCEGPKNGRRDDEFVRLQNVKVPDFAQRSSATEEECQRSCLSDCSCLAYAYDKGLGCMIWNRSLIDIDEFSSGGLDLYVRVAGSKPAGMTNQRIRILIPAIIGPIIFVICVILGWRTLVKYKELKKDKNTLPWLRREDDDNPLRTNMNQVEIKELPMFDFEVLARATNNFDIHKKLGQGGFGPVYKGKLEDGQEIAVKRLSRSSGQGFEEFMNEVSLISKLQHRNLVRLLGCCVEGDEKMLVYEFMPNNSLDVFIFDPRKREVLDWRKRMNIIEGISRGLLYLHRDSRLKIIHRDLKASNILLDEQLNPKISDFGMAKLFGGNEDHGNTNRVVGTYGYMSPEYAMEGLFSVKSDAFSFGVLLLEIVSGRRNSRFYSDDQSLSLLAYAWKLWKEEDISSLIDPSISSQSNAKEIRRCVQIGLLCVQELACDRPNVSTIIWMLGSDSVELPAPKQPGFAVRPTDLNGKSSEESQIIISINNESFTTIIGR